ncbi:hypothetical protein AAHE18_06G210300 [Arachis hypogaea]
MIEELTATAKSPIWHGYVCTSQSVVLDTQRERWLEDRGILTTRKRRSMTARTEAGFMTSTETVRRRVAAAETESERDIETTRRSHAHQLRHSSTASFLCCFRGLRSFFRSFPKLPPLRLGILPVESETESEQEGRGTFGGSSCVSF